MQPRRADAVPERVDVDAMSNRAERFGLGSWIVIPARGLIRSHGVDHRLTPQQMAVLLCLVRRAGVVVSKEELLENVWSGAIVEEGALARCVSELRSALGDDARAPKYIQTVAGHGYRLIIEPKAVVRGTNGGEPVEDGALWGRSRRSWIALSAVLLLGLGATIVLPRLNKVDRALQQDSSGEPMVGRQVGPVVAVLGFRNLSGDAASDWLATAMPELLANELAISDEVRVVPTQSVSRLTRDLAIPEGETLAPETLRQVKSALGVDFVVLGSFLRVPGQMAGQTRLDVRFQDADTAEVITTWNETVVDSDVLSSLSRAGLFLRQALGVHESTGSSHAVAAYLPKNATALRLYYQGVRSLRRFEATAARDYLSRSLALEPGQPFALVALSQAWAALGYDARAVKVARSALEESSSLTRENRLLVEASYYAVSSKWNDAIERYKALWLLVPDNLDYAILLAQSQGSAGLPDRALDTLGKTEAIAGGDTDPRVLLAVAESAARAGKHNRALAAGREASARAEVLGSGLMLARARQAQAVALYGLGRIREASTALEEARSEFGRAGDRASEAGTLGMEADWLIEAGDPEAAKRLLERSLVAYREVGDRRGEAEALARLGQVLSYRGDLDGSRVALTQAISTFVEVQDSLGQATALGALAYAMGSSGQPNEAEPLLREAAQIFESAGAVEQAAAMQSVLGMSLGIMARPKEGLFFLEQAESVFEELGSKYHLGRLRVRKSANYWCQGDLVRANTYSIQAFEIAEDLQNPRLRGFALLNMSRIQTEVGKPELGITTARQARVIARDLSLPTLDVAAIVRQAEAALAMGEIANALQLADEAVQVARTSGKFLTGAYGVYVRALIAAGEWAQAERVIEIAGQFDDGYSGSSIELALTSLRIQIQRGASADMVKQLIKIEETNAERGDWVLMIHARILRGELEGRLGNSQQARAILRQVVVETDSKGWVTLASVARSALAAVSVVSRPGELHSGR